jgi:murein DD-endopeptidase MepM/ murein hydrolase activator NlpD
VAMSPPTPPTPKWVPPGTDVNAGSFAFDMKTGGWVPPGEGKKVDRFRLEMPPGWTPRHSNEAFQIVMTPPGTPAPMGAYTLTPKTKELSPPGKPAPIQETNVSLVPAGNFPAGGPSQAPAPAMPPPAPPPAGGVPGMPAGGATPLPSAPMASPGANAPVPGGMPAQPAGAPMGIPGGAAPVPPGVPPPSPVGGGQAAPPTGSGPMEAGGPPAAGPLPLAEGAAPPPPEREEIPPDLLIEAMLRDLAGVEVAPRKKAKKQDSEVEVGAGQARPQRIATPPGGREPLWDVFPVPGSTRVDWGHGGEKAADIFAPAGSPVVAPEAGRLTFARYPAGGNTFVLDGVSGRRYYMAHLRDDGLILSQPGRSVQVAEGQPIGQVGMTGGRMLPGGGVQRLDESSAHVHIAVSDQPGAFPDNRGTGNLSPRATLEPLYAGRANQSSASGAQPQQQLQRGIVQIAMDAGASPDLAAIMAASALVESSGRPDAVGDGGASVGLWQLHERGAGAGMSREERMNPDRAAQRMVPEFQRAYAAAQARGLQGVELGVATHLGAERPKDQAPNGVPATSFRQRYPRVAELVAEGSDVALGGRDRIPLASTGGAPPGQTRGGPPQIEASLWDQVREQAGLLAQQAVEGVLSATTPTAHASEMGGAPAPAPAPRGGPSTPVLPPTRDVANAVGGAVQGAAGYVGETAPGAEWVREQIRIREESDRAARGLPPLSAATPPTPEAAQQPTITPEQQLDASLNSWQGYYSGQPSPTNRAGDFGMTPPSAAANTAPQPPPGPPQSTQERQPPRAARPNYTWRYQEPETNPVTGDQMPGGWVEAPNYGPWYGPDGQTVIGHWNGERLEQAREGSQRSNEPKFIDAGSGTGYMVYPNGEVRYQQTLADGSIREAAVDRYNPAPPREEDWQIVRGPQEAPLTARDRATQDYNDRSLAQANEQYYGTSGNTAATIAAQIRANADTLAQRQIEHSTVAAGTQAQIDAQLEIDRLKREQETLINQAVSGNTAATLGQREAEDQRRYDRTTGDARLQAGRPLTVGRTVVPINKDTMDIDREGIFNLPPAEMSEYESAQVGLSREGLTQARELAELPYEKMTKAEEARNAISQQEVGLKQQEVGLRGQELGVRREELSSKNQAETQRMGLERERIEMPQFSPLPRGGIARVSPLTGQMQMVNAPEPEAIQEVRGGFLVPAGRSLNVFGTTMGNAPNPYAGMATPQGWGGTLGGYQAPPLTPIGGGGGQGMQGWQPPQQQQGYGWDPRRQQMPRWGGY